ncbi:MAG: hypothetical protein ACK4MQ_10800 [Hyphomonas sp.]
MSARGKAITRRVGLFLTAVVFALGCWLAISFAQEMLASRAKCQAHVENAPLLYEHAKRLEAEGVEGEKLEYAQWEAGFIARQARGCESAVSTGYLLLSALVIVAIPLVPAALFFLFYWVVIRLVRWLAAGDVKSD